MSEVGTLKELGVKVGDVVESVAWGYKDPFEGDEYAGVEWVIHEKHPMGYCGMCAVSGSGHVKIDGSMMFRIIHRANPEPREWQHLTDAEKGALLLAHHREPGSVEFMHPTGGEWVTLKNLGWLDSVKYRIKPEPKVETVTLDTFKHNLQWYGKSSDGRATHRITFNTIDGKPDCASVKMEEV